MNEFHGLAGSAVKSVNPQAEMLSELHGVIGGDFPFAVEDHEPNRGHLILDVLESIGTPSFHRDY